MIVGKESSLSEKLNRFRKLKQYFFSRSSVESPKNIIYSHLFIFLAT